MGSSAKLEEFLNNTGWKARMNGRDISLKSNYSEIVSTKKTEIKIVDPRSNWKANFNFHIFFSFYRDTSLYYLQRFREK